MDQVPSTSAPVISKSANGIQHDAADARVAPGGPSRTGYYRWLICALLLFGVTKNYMDRNVLGVLNVTLQHLFGWSPVDYGNLVAVFQAGYALGLLLIGRLIDRVGTRVGYAVAMAFWSLASTATALGSSLPAFAVSRFILGFGEAAVFPASIKAVAEWFPKRERALATGIFNAGTNAGAILAALVVPWIDIRWGWRAAFIAVGGLGFVWLAFWLAIYRKPEDEPRLSPAELEYIRSDPQEPVVRIRWARLLPLRQTWALVAARFLVDPVWWFYLFWIPAFLQTKHVLSLTGIGLPIMTIYLISDVGSVAGGWISGFLIKRGRSINAARKTAMLICAICAVPVVFAYRVQSTWSAVVLIGIAAACHQGFSCNLYTIVSDMFPTQAVGSVVGIGGMAGAIGGILSAKLVGYLVLWTGNYMVPFLIAGTAYLVALGFIQFLSPKLEPAQIG